MTNAHPLVHLHTELVIRTCVYFSSFKYQNLIKLKLRIREGKKWSTQITKNSTSLVTHEKSTNTYDATLMRR